MSECFIANYLPAFNLLIEYWGLIETVDPADFDRLFQRKFQKITGVVLKPLAREALAGMPHFEIIHRLESKKLLRPIHS